MNIQLNITFTNQNGYEELVSISANKEILINCSTYFESLLSDEFNDTYNKTTIDINLSQHKYFYSANHIKKLFEIELCPEFEYNIPNDNRQIKILLDTNLDKQFEYNFNIKLDFGLTSNIKIEDLYMLLSLVEFFDFEKSRKILEICMENYAYLIFSVNKTVIIDYNSFVFRIML